MDRIVEIIRRLLVLCAYLIAIGIITTFGYTHKERVADQERRQGPFSYPTEPTEHAKYVSELRRDGRLPYRPPRHVPGIPDDREREIQVLDALLADLNLHNTRRSKAQQEIPEAQITAIGCASTLVGGGLLHIIINWVFSIPLPWKKGED